MKVRLRIWRQANADATGRLVDYDLDGVEGRMSFLEMLDLLNDGLIRAGQEPVAFDSDCREGICGACGLWINGRAHGRAGLTTCLLHMRDFADGATIVVEPWRARAFPVLKDLIVDRSALDRIVQAGGYVSTSTGTAPEANSLPVGRDQAEAALDAAACIGCGACVAACKNASATLFVAAKVSHLARLPQGKPEATTRARRMVARMEAEGFGDCTNTEACSAVCPQGIGVDTIGTLNWEYLKAQLGPGR